MECKTSDVPDSSLPLSLIGFSIEVQIHSISNWIDQRQLQFSKNVMFYLDLKHFDDKEGPQDFEL